MNQSLRRYLKNSLCQSLIILKVDILSPLLACARPDTAPVNLHQKLTGKVVDVELDDILLEWYLIQCFVNALRFASCLKPGLFFANAPSRDIRLKTTRGKHERCIANLRYAKRESTGTPPIQIDP